MEFKGLPNEVTATILSYLSIRELVQARLVSSGFNKLCCSDYVWGVKLVEDFPGDDDTGEAVGTRLQRYQFLHSTRLRFDLAFGVNVEVAATDGRTICHGNYTSWASALIPYPKISIPKHRGHVFGIRIRIEKYVGNGFLGLVGFDDYANATKGKRSFSIHESGARPRIWRADSTYMRDQTTLQGVNKLFSSDGCVVEMELDLDANTLSITAHLSDKEPKIVTDSKAADLEEGVDYCWAVSMGWLKSVYVIEKGWHRIKKS